MIQPYVRVPSFCSGAEAVTKKHNFVIDKVIATKHKNGLISVIVNWDKASSNFRSMQPYGRMYGYSDIEYHLTPSVKTTYRFTVDGRRMTVPYSIDVGLCTTDESKINYEPLFFENLKYGVRVWFGPKGWDSDEDAEQILCWDEVQDKLNEK